jgi:hypothetical protein
VFAYLRDNEDPDEATDDLGRIFFFAEFATAVAGWALEINAFDQPDVQVAKDMTGKLLAAIEGGGSLDEPDDADDDALRALLTDGGDEAYVAILGFMAPSDDVDAAVTELRAAIRDATQATTTFGYGPRYLHSTGQLHKGGPASGRFLVLIHDGAQDVEIPGRPFGFRLLKTAQAFGDLETLRSRGRSAEKLRLEGDDAAAALRELTQRVRGLFGG